MPPEFSQLLSASLGADKAIDEDDPYNPLQQGAQTIDQALLAHAQQGSIGQGIAAALLSGVFGGVSDNLSRGYKEDQNSAVQAALPDVLNGRAITQGNMGPSVFNRLQQEGTIRKFDKEQKKQDLQDELDQYTSKLKIAGPIENENSINKMVAEAPIQLTIDKLKGDQQLKNEETLRGVPTYADTHRVDKSTVPPKARDLLAGDESLIHQVDSLKDYLPQMAGNQVMRATRSLDIGGHANLDTPEGQYENQLTSLGSRLALQFGKRVATEMIDREIKTLSLHRLGATKQDYQTAVDRLSGVLRDASDTEASAYDDPNGQSQQGTDLLRSIRAKMGSRNSGVMSFDEWKASRGK